MNDKFKKKRLTAMSTFFISPPFGLAGCPEIKITSYSPMDLVTK